MYPLVLSICLDLAVLGILGIAPSVLPWVEEPSINFN